MIALDAALRRLTVCQLTRESRGNGGGLRPRVWLRRRAAAGGNWTPDGILQLEGEANFSLSSSMKRTQKLLCIGLFSKKLNGPLLTGQQPRIQVSWPRMAPAWERCARPRYCRAAGRVLSGNGPARRFTASNSTGLVRSISR